MPGKPGKKTAPRAGAGALSPVELLWVALLLAVLSAAAILFFLQRGELLFWGDAAAHLNIARRVLDSRTPGPEQIGTVWLPLPHLLMLPFAAADGLWRSGLAGAIPSGLCFVIAGLFLFAAMRLIFESRAPAVVAVLLFACNPNLLYMQSIAMTEAVFFAALMALLYFTARFRVSQSMGAVLGAALAALAATLTRYEGWFLLPFVALYILFTARRGRFAAGLLFGAVAALGPLAWLAHNWWYWGNPLEFYNGPYSAIAIYRNAMANGMAPYPGDHDWLKAWQYFRAAAALCAGWPLVWLGLAGIAAALIRRAFWPLLLLALPAVFYVCSMYSSGTPIFVPHLWPNTYYNTRYGLAAFPGLVFAAAALAALAPARLRVAVAALLVAAAVAPWLGYPRSDNWVCWKESQVNSVVRRAWTHEAAGFFRANYRPGQGILMSFGDQTDIFREAGVPLRALLHEGNQLQWFSAVGRPDLFLTEKWAVGFSGDRVTTALLRAQRTGPRYDCVLRIARPGAPVVEIYRRMGH